MRAKTKSFIECLSHLQLRATQNGKIALHFLSIATRLLVIKNKKKTNFNSASKSNRSHSNESTRVEIPNSASLSLQILLFINVYLCAFWMMSMLQFFYMHAFDDSGKHNTIVLGAALFLIAAPLEICRLYLGYSGNLREMVCHQIFFIFFFFIYFVL